jgi:hypothetical protein
MKAVAFAIVAVLGLTGCAPPVTPPKAPPPQKPAPGAVKQKVEIGKNVHFETTVDGRRRITIPAEVCFREGPLEMFLCRKGTKEHESVLSADIDARDLHKALLAAGAESGSPVVFEPTYRPACGTAIRVTVSFTRDGKEVSADARTWVRDFKTKKALDKDWVFAGSAFRENPDDPKKPKLYLANGGDVVCVSNFTTAMLDLPVNSSAENEELMFEAFTDNIPPLGTKVTVTFEPLPTKKAADKAP